VITWEIKLAALAIALGGLLAAFLMFVHSERKAGAMECQANVAKGVAAAQAAASATEAEWQRRAIDAYHQHEIQIQNVTAERDAALASLRNRPPRRPDLPASAAAACAGARGADLSAQDADDLVNLAYDADRLRAAYDELRAWAEALIMRSTNVQPIPTTR
jgi:hypothetical protein